MSPELFEESILSWALCLFSHGNPVEIPNKDKMKGSPDRAIKRSNTVAGGVLVMLLAGVRPPFRPSRLGGRPMWPGGEPVPELVLMHI